MGEVVNVLVAFAVIVIIFRWVTSGQHTSPGSFWFFNTDPFAFGQRQATTRLEIGQLRILLAFDQRMSRRRWCVWSLSRISAVLISLTHLQVDTIHSMFPDIPALVTTKMDLTSGVLTLTPATIYVTIY
jgi:hypothetical protein